MLFARSKALNNLNYFNLGVSDSSTKVKEIANLLLKCLNSDAKIIYGQEKKGWVGDVPKFSFSTKKINDLGWFPCLTSNQAVEKAIKEIICEIG
jgi:UDP-glucose 4-epimerase